MVGRFFFGFVAAAKAGHVGCHYPVPGGGEHGQHLAVKVAPGRVAVQAKPGERCRTALPLRHLVQVVHTQPGQRRQLGHIAGLPGVSGQPRKTGVGGAHGIVAHRHTLQGMRPLHTALLLEEALQQRCTLLPQNPPLHTGLVVQPGLGKEVQHRPCRPGAGLGRAKHHPLEPGVQHGAAAHGAGLECDEQLAAVEPVVPQHPGGFTQGVDLGMAGGIVGGDRGVVSGGDHHAVLDHHRPYWHLAGHRRSTGGGKGLRHQSSICRFIAINLIALCGGNISA